MKKIMYKLKEHKLITSLILVILMSFVTVNEVNRALYKAADLKEVPVASRYLKSNTLITEADIRYIEIPSFIIMDSVILDKKKIIGKYIDTRDSLSEGSLFYNEVIVSDKQIDNAYLFKLEAGEVAISIDSSVKDSYSNSILPNQYVDLYYMGKSDVNSFDNKDLYVYGQIVKSARVLAVKDKNGENIDADSELNTNVIVVALKQEDAHLVNLAKEMGEVSMVISYDNIKDAETNNYYNMDKIRKIIELQSLSVESISNLSVNNDE